MVHSDLNEFSRDFHVDIATEAEALELFKEQAFVEKMTEILVDYGETEECTPCHWQDRGFKVDAFSFDDEHTNLSIIISHFLDASDSIPPRVTNTDVNAAFKRARNFLQGCLTGKLHGRIDISNPAHDLAELILDCKKDLLSCKIILATDGLTRERHAEVDEIEGIEVTCVIWDLERTHTFLRTGQREQISINFFQDYGGAIPCLKMGQESDKYTTYLAFVHGNVLADLYRDWKIRLLERNVRVFLSQRPKVNRGIRDTIINEPEMFCAYNNGITVIAQDVVLGVFRDGSLGISVVNDFQIVNGGQTTASLYHTREKSRADLNNVLVQMKLMIVNEAAKPSDLPADQLLADHLIPRISLYSNTQNRVQTADLLANEPPHPELHAISLNMPAPDPTGGSVQSFWFYEKSRGSYEETRRLQARTDAQRKVFDQKYPKRQKFDKGKFGKAWNSFLRKPHIVSMGAMKSFGVFNSWLQEQEYDWQEFFRKTVALVLMWNEAEKIVRKANYGGYRHAIVTYSLAWLHEITGTSIDLDKIWLDQQLSPEICDSIGTLADEVNMTIRDTDLNISEWCKKEDCWKKLQSRPRPALPDLSGSLLGSKNNQKEKFNPDTKQDRDNREFCASKGPDAWFALAKWLKERNFMQGKQRSQSANMGKKLRSGGEPSEVLAYACQKIWKDAEVLGWSFEVD
jgi:hypothetical protein